MRPGKQESRRRAPAFLLQPTNGAYFFFLAPPFFAAFFFFAAIVLSMERVLNAGPIPRWIGRQQPDCEIRLVPRAGTNGAKHDRLPFKQRDLWSIRSAATIINSYAKRPATAPDGQTLTHKVVKEISRTFKGGASNLPAT